MTSSGLASLHGDICSPAAKCIFYTPIRATGPYLYNGGRTEKALFAAWSIYILKIVSTSLEHRIKTFPDLESSSYIITVHLPATK